MSLDCGYTELLPEEQKKQSTVSRVWIRLILHGLLEEPMVAHWQNQACTWEQRGEIII